MKFLVSVFLMLVLPAVSLSTWAEATKASMMVIGDFPGSNHLQTTRITLTELWFQYGSAIAVVLATLVLVLAATGAWLLRQHRLVRLGSERYRAQTDRLSEVLWGTNAGTWEWSIATGETILNDRCAEIIGYTLAELAPLNIHTWMQRTHPDDLKASSELVARCFSRDVTDYKCEARMRHKNGNWVWVLSRGRVVEWTPDGKPLRMAGTLADIGERKHVEAGLRASEKRFHDLFENSPDPSWLIKGRKMLDCNLATVKVLGYKSRAEVLLHPARLSPEFQPDGRASKEKAQEMMGIARAHGMHRFEWVHRRADGSSFPVEVTLARLALEDGEMLYCIWRDITERKRAEQREQHRSRILQMLAANAPVADVLDAIVRDVEAINPTLLCSILLLSDDGKSLRLGAAYGLPDFYTEAVNGLAVGQGIGSCGTAAFTGERVIVEDIASHPAWAPFRELARRAGLGACWSQPVLSMQAKVLGTFAIYHDHACSPSPADLQLLEDEARLVALASEKATSEERLQLAANVFTHAREGIIITDAAGTIVDVNESFTLITGYGREESIGQNPRMLQSGRQGPEFYAQMWQALKEQAHWNGEIWNRRKNGEIYIQSVSISAVRDPGGKAQHYVSLFADVTAFKAHQTQLEHIAHYDALTGLPNRVLLADRLRLAMLQSQRRNLSLAVAYLDLDGFKAVNDIHGHDMGDELLITIAQHMKATLRDGDTLARIGGDEFVVVLTDLEHPKDCDPVLARLLQAAAEVVMLGHTELQVSASIGVTLYPQDGGDADQLLRHADQAMYLAKQAGKNRYHLFDVAHDAAVKTQRESLEHIADALKREEFVLHYQPKVNMKTGDVIGVEALIRWQHPQQGLLPPVTFLPVIENHSLSVDVGEWVINTALAQMAAWSAAGLHMPVSVNVGARQLQHAGFVTRLSELLAAHPTVEPVSLELEVLETSAMEDIVHVGGIMHACRALGVRFALDDFGTGYSSLTYLKHLPAGLVKIDQSFVRDMLDDTDDLAIVESVIGLAKAFRRDVIAEGVETIPHGELLLTLGCELAQGFGIARPMPANELAGWTARWRSDAAWTAWRERAMNRNDLVVAFAEVGHRHWLRSIELYLSGDSKTAPPMDARDCHFGRWQETEGRLRFGRDARFAALEALHQQIHALGQVLMTLHASGEPSRARTGLEEMRPLMDELVGRFRALMAG